VPALERALILLALGETDSVQTAIGRLLTRPSRMTVHAHRLDPV